MTVKLPRTFLEDHIDRGLDDGISDVEPVGRHRLRATLTPEALAELRSDAAYYGGPYGPDAMEDGGRLARSARATLAALDRAVHG